MNYVKIPDMEYKRVLKEDIISSIEKCIKMVENASSGDDLLKAREIYNEESEALGTMVRLAHTRLNLNSRDEFYSGEMDYYNSALPEIQMYDIKFSKAFLASPYLEKAKKSLNPLVVTMMALSLKTADERILEEMQKENMLTTEYGKFVSELTQERIMLGSGTIYGTLTKMQKSGLIGVYDDSDKKIAYEITDLGKNVLNAEIDRIKLVYRDAVSQERFFGEGT